MKICNSNKQPNSFADKKRVDLLAYYQPNTLHEGHTRNKSVDMKLSGAANLFDPSSSPRKWHGEIFFLVCFASFIGLANAS